MFPKFCLPLFNFPFHLCANKIRHSSIARSFFRSTFALLISRLGMSLPFTGLSQEEEEQKNYNLHKEIVSSGFLVNKAIIIFQIHEYWCYKFIQT